MKITKKEVTQEIVTIEMSLEDYEFLRQKLLDYNLTIPEHLNDLKLVSDSDEEKLSDLMGKLTKIV